MEFAPKPDSDEDSSKLVALIEDFKYEGKDGIFLSSSSADEVHERGKKTFEDRYKELTGKDLYRIEFTPFHGDYIIGMFLGWGLHKISNNNSIILYIPKSKVF